MCNAQVTDDMKNSGIVTVPPMGESATGPKAHPIFRLPALQLLAIARLLLDRCALPGKKIGD